MNVLILLIPISILFGLAALWLLSWNLKTGQYDDLEGSAQRILTKTKTDN